MVSIFKKKIICLNILKLVKFEIQLLNNSLIDSQKLFKCIFITILGVLSMKRIPPTDNNSQFCITFQGMESLDHKNVVFGKVIKGNDNLFKINGYARRIGKPYAEIIIADCGEMGEIQRNGTQKYVQKVEKNNVGTSNIFSNEVGNTNVKSVKECKCLPVC